MARPLAVSDGNLDLTLSIDDLSHDFHVIRVHAEGVAAEMVDDKASRDLKGVSQLVGDSMGLHDSTTGLESAISERHRLRVVFPSLP